MTNQLARHLTPWKGWYALLAVPAFLLGSLVMTVSELTGSSPDAPRETVTALLVPVQFIALAVLALAFLAVAARRWPTTRDLALVPGLTKRDLVVLAVVFVVTHVIFWLLTLGEPADPDEARRYFEEMHLAAGLLPAVSSVVSAVILAPVCEKLLYRGAMLRPIHDALARRGSGTLAAIVSILVSAGFFAMPHLGGSLTGRTAIAYVVTGIAFGLVYVITGSMTAAMVSHSLQRAASRSRRC